MPAPYTATAPRAAAVQGFCAGFPTPLTMHVRAVMPVAAPLGAVPAPSGVGAPAVMMAQGAVAPAVIKRSYVTAKSLSLKYRFDGDFTAAGRPLLLTSDPADSERAHSATGLRVWDGGIVLARYLERYVPERLTAAGGRRLRALELGCGTGVAGLAFAFLGQEVALSDVGDLQRVATEANVARNQASIDSARGSVSYHAVDWKNLPNRESFGHFDVVFAGDVIWHETLVAPFMDALQWAVSGPGTGEILLSHKVRDEESVALFERHLQERGLLLTKKVPTEPLLDPDGHPEVCIYHLRSK